MFLIQIVPGLFPQLDGIGDYALALAHRLREEHGVRTLFLVYNPAWRGGAIDGFPAIAVAERSAAAMERAIDALSEHSASAVPVLLHFAPYGYEKRGAPILFTSFLQRWSVRHPGRLNTAFHELENHTSNILSSTFWFTPLQRALVGQVARLAGFKYTNTEVHRQKLEAAGASRVALIPNVSTLGEPEIYPEWGQRSSSLVIFGRRAQRREAYGRGLVALQRLCRSLGIRQIIDIGDPLEGIDRLVPEVELIVCGRLSAAEVIRHMSQAMGSFLSYPVALLTKSSIHAVSCACGTPAFVHDPTDRVQECPPLAASVDYVVVSPAAGELASLPMASISRQIFENYQRRSSRVAAARLVEAMGLEQDV